MWSIKGRMNVSGVSSYVKLLLVVVVFAQQVVLFEVSFFLSQFFQTLVVLVNLVHTRRLLRVLREVRRVLSGLGSFLLFDHVKGEVLHIFKIALGVEGLIGAKALASERLVIIILHELREARLVVLFIIFLDESQHFFI